MLTMATTEGTAGSGVSEVSGILGGGINEGSFIFIEGFAKAGKSVLAQHIAQGILRSGSSSVVYYTVGHTEEELIAQMDSLGLNAKQDYLTDRLRIYPLGSSNAYENVQRATLRNLIKHILYQPRRFGLIIIDPLTPLMTRVSPRVKVDFFYACKELCENGQSIVMVLDRHILESKTLNRIHAMSDYYLRLKSKDMVIGEGQLEERTIKVLEVTKLSGVEQYADDIRFEIIPHVGIQILPLHKIRV